MDISLIRSMIRTAGAKWAPGVSAISRLADDQQDLRLGLSVPAGEMERVESLMMTDRSTFQFARNRDWRDKDGEHWMTDIQDQGGCGSCVAFAAVATLEAQARIQENEPRFDINLSEADLFFCGAGQKCRTGWWPANALAYAEENGVSDEACFPYQDHDMACQLCTDKADRLIKIGQWHEFVNVDQRKQWLDTMGPMIACMAVYRDFFSYKEGIYEHVYGDLAGYHAVCCVGYSEDEQCWICKNSWGPDWGMDGYFKIAYGQADMDTSFAMYGVEELAGPLLPTEEEETKGWVEKLVVVYKFEENKPMLWAYVEDKWRHQLLSGTELGNLAEIFMASSAVEATYEEDELTRVRAWKEFT